MAGPLRMPMMLRGVLALLAIPAAFASPWLGLLFLLAAELIERVLFFRAVSAPKMPGNFGPQAIAHS